MSLLLTSVFRPFGVDDEYGRKENKLELFHNQVTREQGIFSLRYNHRSFGLYFIAENIKMPTVILDFPTLKQFRKEVGKGYDYVGISFIAPNFVKARKMAEIVREVSPATKIILGGHGTMIPDIENLIDSDHVVRGEGIYQLRKLFGEEVDAPIRHPILPSAENKRVLGFPVGGKAAVLIPGVGCPNACRFCCTSHFFQKEYTPYLKTGREIFDVLVRISDEHKTDEFFVMDENFLKYKERAMELLALMEQEKRYFNFSIFSSAEAITAFGIENMVKLGIAYVWIGAESRQTLFEKTKGIDVKELIAEMRAHGIFVLASSILFLEHQDKENIWSDIDYAISLKPDFTQFMQLGPLPQTRLYQEYKEQGILREDIPYEEWHGQHRLWFDHPNFTGEESEVILRDAFRKEYETLGPSILRIGETLIRGLRHKVYQTEDSFMKRRYEFRMKRCRSFYHAVTPLKWLVPTKNMKEFATGVLAMYRENLGRRTPAHFASASFIYTGALLERARLALGREAHNPKPIKTFFRLEPAMYREMKGKIMALLRNRKTWAFLEPAPAGGSFQLSVHFSGKIKERTVEKIMRKLNAKQQLSLKAVRINITPLARFRDETLEKLVEKMSGRCQDIQIYMSESQKRRVARLERLLSKRFCSVKTY